MSVHIPLPPSNVQATETSNGLVDEVFDFVVMAHIGAYKFGLGPEVAQFSGQLLTLIVVSTRDNDSRSFSRESQSCGAPDSRQYAGN